MNILPEIFKSDRWWCILSHYSCCSSVWGTYYYLPRASLGRQQTTLRKLYAYIQYTVWCITITCFRAETKFYNCIHYLLIIFTDRMLCHLTGHCAWLHDYTRSFIKFCGEHCLLSHVYSTEMGYLHDNSHTKRKRIKVRVKQHLMSLVMKTVNQAMKKKKKSRKMWRTMLMKM